LTGDVTVERKGIDIVLSRQGPGLTMKIQAKDCAAAVVFQMEVPGRRDRDRFTHVLAEGIFYSTPELPSPGGRRRALQRHQPSRDSAHQLRQRFVSSVRRRDSPGRHPSAGAGVVNQIATRTGGTATVRHCQPSRAGTWRAAADGQVWARTPVEVGASPLHTALQARDRVKARHSWLGFPFAVPVRAGSSPRSGSMITMFVLSRELARPGVIHGRPQ